MINNNFKNDILKTITDKQTNGDKSSILPNFSGLMNIKIKFNELINNATGFNNAVIINSEIYKDLIIFNVRDNETIDWYSRKTAIVVVNKYFQVLQTYKVHKSTETEKPLNYIETFTPSPEGSLWLLIRERTNTGKGYINKVIKTNSILKDLNNNDLFYFRELQIELEDTTGGSTPNFAGLKYLWNIKMSLDQTDNTILNISYLINSNNAVNQGIIFFTLKLLRIKATSDELEQLTHDNIISEPYKFLNVDNVEITTKSINDTNYSFSVWYNQEASQKIKFLPELFFGKYVGKQTIISEAQRVKNKYLTEINNENYNTLFLEWNAGLTSGSQKDYQFIKGLNSNYGQPSISSRPQRVLCEPVNTWYKYRAGNFITKDNNENVWWNIPIAAETNCSATTGTYNPNNAIIIGLVAEIEISTTKGSIFFNGNVADGTSAINKSVKFNNTLDCANGDNYFYYINNEKEIHAYALDGTDNYIANGRYNKFLFNYTPEYAVDSFNNITLLYKSVSGEIRDNATAGVIKETDYIHYFIMQENNLKILIAVGEEEIFYINNSYSDQTINSTEYVYIPYNNSSENLKGIRIRLLRNTTIFYDSFLKDLLISGGSAVFNSFIDYSQATDFNFNKIQLISNTNNIIFEDTKTIDKDRNTSISLNVNFQLIVSQKIENEIINKEDATRSTLKILNNKTQQDLARIKDIEITNSNGDIKKVSAKDYIIIENDKYYIKASFINDIKKVRILNYSNDELFNYDLNLQVGQYCNFTIEIKLIEE